MSDPADLDGDGEFDALDISIMEKVMIMAAGKVAAFLAFGQIFVASDNIFPV